jgi:transposase
MGFSKDGKIGKTQILFSLLIDKNKVPSAFRSLKATSMKVTLLKRP